MPRRSNPPKRRALRTRTERGRKRGKDPTFRKTSGKWSGTPVEIGIHGKPKK